MLQHYRKYYCYLLFVTRIIIKLYSHRELHPKKRIGIKHKLLYQLNVDLFRAFSCKNHKIPLRWLHRSGDLTRGNRKRLE